MFIYRLFVCKIIRKLVILMEITVENSKKENDFKKNIEIIQTIHQNIHINKRE